MNGTYRYLVEGRGISAWQVMGSSGQGAETSGNVVHVRKPWPGFHPAISTIEGATEDNGPSLGTSDWAAGSRDVMQKWMDENPF